MIQVGDRVRIKPGSPDHYDGWFYRKQRNTGTVIDSHWYGIDYRLRMWIVRYDRSRGSLSPIGGFFFPNELEVIA